VTALATILQAIRDLCQALLERIDPVAHTPTIPPPAPSDWDQRELMACRDMAAVDVVLARWQSEGLSPVMIPALRMSEEHRRFREAPINSWHGGQG
jgi:hypothetical protein